MAEKKQSLCDETNFDHLFKKEGRTLASYLYYKFGDKAMAQDMVQEAFIKLWHKCAEVPLEKARGFLYTVASNLATSMVRHDQVKLRHREQVMKVNEGRVENESPEFVILEKEFMEKLKNAIGRLPVKQREAYLLNRVEKKTYKEISEIMDVSVKAIEKLIHKALQKLRNEIGDI